MAEQRTVERPRPERPIIREGHPAWPGLVEAVRRGNRALIAREREVRSNASR